MLSIATIDAPSGEKCCAHFDAPPTGLVMNLPDLHPGLACRRIDCGECSLRSWGRATYECRDPRPGLRSVNACRSDITLKGKGHQDANRIEPPDNPHLSLLPLAGVRMHVTDLPINQMLGIRLALAGSEHVLELPAAPLFANHLGSIHVTAQFALAEAASGEFLLEALGVRQIEVVGILRRAEIKCSRPANGLLRAWARFETIADGQRFDLLWEHARTTVNVRVEIRDAANNLTMRTVHGWFLQVHLPHAGRIPAVGVLDDHAGADVSGRGQAVA